MKKKKADEEASYQRWKKGRWLSSNVFTTPDEYITEPICMWECEMLFAGSVLTYKYRRNGAYPAARAVVEGANGIQGDSRRASVCGVCGVQLS